VASDGFQAVMRRQGSAPGDLSTLYIASLTAHNMATVAVTAVSIPGTLARSAKMSAEGWMMFVPTDDEKYVHVLMAVNTPDNHRGWMDVATILAGKLDTIVTTSTGLLVVASDAPVPVAGQPVAGAFLHSWAALLPLDAITSIVHSADGAPGVAPKPGYSVNELSSGLLSLLINRSQTTHGNPNMTTVLPSSLQKHEPWRALPMMQLIIVIAVAVVVLVGLGLYVGWRCRSHRNAVAFERLYSEVSYVSGMVCQHCKYTRTRARAYLCNQAAGEVVDEIADEVGQKLTGLHLQVLIIDRHADIHVLTG